MKMLLQAVIMCVCIHLLGCTSTKTATLSVEAAAGKKGLVPCPGTPNCVSSIDPKDEHYIAPLSYTGNKDDAHQKLVALIASQPRARIVVEEANYLRVEFKTAIFRFVDDVEFWFAADQPVIDIRSASRVGRSDFGVNRKRIEHIRDQYNQEPAQ